MRGEPSQMSLIEPEGQNGELDKDLSRSREHFQNAIDVFQKMTRDVARGNPGTEAENNKIIRALGTATQLLLNEKQRVEAHINKQAGVVGGYALDLDAARDEILRRLARIRDAARD